MFPTLMPSNGGSQPATGIFFSSCPMESSLFSHASAEISIHQTPGNVGLILFFSNVLEAKVSVVTFYSTILKCLLLLILTLLEEKCLPLIDLGRVTCLLFLTSLGETHAYQSRWRKGQRRKTTLVMALVTIVRGIGLYKYKSK